MIIAHYRRLSLVFYESHPPVGAVTIVFLPNAVMFCNFANFLVWPSLPGPLGRRQLEVIFQALD